MKKKHYKITPIRKGEDTPCKECDVYWDNGFHCSGNCQLIRRWKYIPVHEVVTVKDIVHVFDYHNIVGYIYKRIK